MRLFWPFAAVLIVMTDAALQFSACSDRSGTGKINTQGGAYFSGETPNLFRELLNQSDPRINEKIEKTFQHLFYGEDSSERVYYAVGLDLAYIQDTYYKDVRTEGMSYGMMICVQLDRKAEFDRLWKWAKTYMQHRTEERSGFFAWHCRPDGTMIDSTAAPDGEEWMVTALFFAAARWGNGEGIFDYRSEAQSILDAMLNKAACAGRSARVTSMFNRQKKQVVFVPSGEGCHFTDPSYHLPHFYELWGRWSARQNKFWCEAADSSRRFLKKTVHPQTGLAPDYALFDGSPIDAPWGGGHDDFRFDAWRVAMNIAVDYVWFARDEWAVKQSNRILDFFSSKGVSDYGNQFALDGKQLSADHSTGLVAMNAAACLAATNKHRKQFVQDLWDAEIPSGTYRYYNGLLYMLGMLQVSGKFRIYDLPERQ